MKRNGLPLIPILLCAAAVAPSARGHYVWLTIQPGSGVGGSIVRAFFNEDPTPDAAFVDYVRDVRPTVEGSVVATRLFEASRDGHWAGAAPALVDAESDLGVKSREGKSYRLRYTARAQSRPLPEGTAEKEKGLRVRLTQAEGRPAHVEVLFDGKPVPKARIRLYPREGKPSETTADDDGRATVPDLLEGRTSLWANWVEPGSGEVGGKGYSETRHYATFTYRSIQAPSAFGRLSDPAVTSLGAAVRGDRLYVYGGHVGKTHRYDEGTATGRFRRVPIGTPDGSWEDLPPGPPLQGVTLVSDGRMLYRVGGMAAHNKPDAEQDMRSVAQFARFDPERKLWTDLAPLPEPRSTHDAVVIGRTLYVVGGWNMKGATDESVFANDALAFDLDHPEGGWKKLPQPFRRRALAAGSCRGKLFVLGGLTDDSMKVERRVDVYDPAANSWSRGPDLPPGPRSEGFASSACDFEGRLYVSGASGRVHRLTEDGRAWEAVGALAVPRLAHRLLAAPGRGLIAVGGSGGGRTTDVVESILVGPTPTTGDPR